MHLISETSVSRACALAQAAAMALVLGTSAASANAFVIAIDDLADRIAVATLKNGAPDGPTQVFSGEFAQSVQELSGAYDLRNFPVNINIVSPANNDEDEGALSDTFRIDGQVQSAGIVRFSYTFISDVNPNPPENGALPNPFMTIVETGGFQPLFSISGLQNSNSDTLDFMFRSDVTIPGPVVGAGLPGLIAACGVLLVLARRRRQLVV